MSDNYNFIAENIRDIRGKIEAAAAKSGRTAEDITIVAVTKTVDIERIGIAIKEGIFDLGENRVQELLEKHDNINRKCRWHLIGHLQSNKVKYIIDKVDLIHSVDSFDLAREIDKRAGKAGKVMDVLLQVNVSGEETKFGMPPGEVMHFAREVSKYGNIRVRGLMTIAPYAENAEDVRGVFRELRKIFIDIKKENIDNIYMDYLSMGMSNDFEIAIEEGANLVRIGTAIFGRRNY